jgi:kinesin family protein 11
MEGGVPNCTSPGNREHWQPQSIHAGVIPRAIHQIFDSLTREALERGMHDSAEHSVRVSHLELYNEELRDLLAVEEKALKLFDDGNRGVRIHNLEERLVQSADDISHILEMSSERRSTAPTQLNWKSSRSHSIFTITIHIKETTATGEEMIRIGKLNLVDLAGSENIGRSGAREMRQREAGNINQSLLTLGRVIHALTEHQPHVPYRESKLTRLLQESLGGRAKTAIIATVSPSSDAMEETLSTLEYAYRAKSIKNRPEVNARMTKRALIREYEKDIHRLKQMLAAARTKNGIYLPPEEFERLERDARSSAEQGRDLEDRLAMRETQLAEVQDAYNRMQAELRSKDERLRTALERIDKTERELRDERVRREELLAAQTQLEIVLSEREITDTKLRNRIRQLESLLANSEAAKEGLYAKLDRVSEADQTNRSREEKFARSMRAKSARVAAEATAFADAEVASLARFAAAIDAADQDADEHARELRNRIGSLGSMLREQFEHLRTVAAQHHEQHCENADKAVSLKDAAMTAAAREVADNAAAITTVLAEFADRSASQRAALAVWSEQAQVELDEMQARVHTFARKHCDYLTELGEDFTERTTTSKASLEERAGELERFEREEAEQRKVNMEDLMRTIGAILRQQQEEETARLSVRIRNSVDALRDCAAQADATNVTALDGLSRIKNSMWDSANYVNEGLIDTNDSLESRIGEVQHFVDAAGELADKEQERTEQSLVVSARRRREYSMSVNILGDRIRDSAGTFFNKHNFALETLQTDMDERERELRLDVGRGTDARDEARRGLMGHIDERRFATKDYSMEHTEHLKSFADEVSSFFVDVEVPTPTGMTPVRKRLEKPKEPIAFLSREAIIEHHKLRNSPASSPESGDDEGSSDSDKGGEQRSEAQQKASRNALADQPAAASAPAPSSSTSTSSSSSTTTPDAENAPPQRQHASSARTSSSKPRSEKTATSLHRKAMSSRSSRTTTKAAVPYRKTRIS